MRTPLIALVLAHVAFAQTPPPWDSRNISADNWVCAGAYMIMFGSQSVTCGTEVLYAATQTEPIFTVCCRISIPLSCTTIN